MALEGIVTMIIRPGLAGRIHAAVDALDATIRDIRSVIFALQSRDAGHPASLRSQIADVVEEIAPLLGFTPSLRLGRGLEEEEAPQPAEYLLAALAARHAHATRVDVSAEMDSAGMLTLRVSDD